MQPLIDIGVNLAHESFAHDRDDVLARSVAAGVTRLIITGTTVAGSVAALSAARERPGQMYATAGIHPHHATEFHQDARSQLLDLLEDPAVVAAGECGLDYFRNYSPRVEQTRAFEGQLRLAADAGKPVFLHQRDAHVDFLAMLRDYRPGLTGGVAHCFTEGPAELDEYLDLGLYVGITGWICDERRSGPLRLAVRNLPLDRVLLETDAPYLLPRSLSPRPGTRRNEPAYLPHVLEVLAGFMDRPVADIAAASTRNAEKLFNLSPGNR